jgi:hypothetical protein
MGKLYIQYYIADWKGEDTTNFKKETQDKLLEHAHATFQFSSLLLSFLFVFCCY